MFGTEAVDEGDRGGILEDAGIGCGDGQQRLTGPSHVGLVGNRDLDVDSPARFAGVVGNGPVPQLVVVGEDVEAGRRTEPRAKQADLDDDALDTVAGDVIAHRDGADPGEHDAGRDVA